MSVLRQVWGNPQLPVRSNLRSDADSARAVLYTLIYNNDEDRLLSIIISFY
ncbi:hypothetical protein CKA32_007026 [Geitlerinema sp. FC II]|nr:hypothetical protein CKA32_007026 [Geitlerinema sp. FC II]